MLGMTAAMRITRARHAIWSIRQHHGRRRPLPLPSSWAIATRRPVAGAAQRCFSSEEPTKEKKKDLRESVERLKGASNNDPDHESNHESNHDPNKESNNDPGSESVGENPTYQKLAAVSKSFLSSLSQTWSELLASGQAEDINKKLRPPQPKEEGVPNYDDDDAAADKYEAYKGSREIMLIDPEEHLTAWERMERRLRDAPIIQGIMEKSNEIYEKSGAQKHVQKTQQTITHLREDAAEAWETSQNPWVYRASSIYDTLTAESEFATAARLLRHLDPDFTFESWKRNVVERTLPRIMQLFLEGRIQELKPWLGEAVYNRLAAEMRARKKEGVQIDTNVLAIMNAEILACEISGTNGEDPIVLLHFMCQQIHCVRKKKSNKDDNINNDQSNKSKMDDSEETTNDNLNQQHQQQQQQEQQKHTDQTYAEQELGEIVEGGEDDIRANSYVVAFQREYDEQKMELNWKIVDFRFNGAIAYL